MPKVKTPEQNRALWQQRRARNLERAMEMPRVACECGCGTMILALQADGTKRRYADNHGLHPNRRAPVLAAGSFFPEFSERGACTQPWVDPEWFWADSSDPDTQDDAKRLCFGCPIRSECLQWAADRGEPGIWGGTTREERGRARLRKAAA